MSFFEYPFVSRHFTLPNGHRMHYVDEGQGPVLVFLHGNPTWSYYWRNLLKALSQKYRVIAPDHLGCGLSDKPQTYEYRLKNHIDNVKALLGHLQAIDITLFLHDWGGAIGMGYAVDNPANVKRFVVFNTAAFPSKKMPIRLSLCRTPGLGKLAIQGLNAFAWGATQLATTKGLPPAVRRAYLKPYDTFQNRIATYEFVRDIPLSPRHPSWNTLQRIEQGLTEFRNRPITLIWGAKDFVFTTHFLDEWKRRFPQSESHLFSEAGHYIVEDEAEKVLSLSQSFLERTADA